MGVGGQVREWSGDALRKKFPEDRVDVFEERGPARSPEQHGGP